MFIDWIKLNNFRNYEEIDLFPQQLNILIGDNAQGKSNFIESIYFLGSGFSYRTNQSRDLIKWNKDFLKIEATIVNNDDKVNIKSYLNKKSRKILIDEIPVKKLSALFGNLPVCIFEPDDLMIIKGKPGNRRSFIDREMMLFNPVYYDILRKFYNVNYQRNSLLKMIRKNKTIANSLNEWNQLYIKLAYKIVLKRIEFLRMIVPFFKTHFEKITQGKEKIEITYDINQMGNNPINKELIYDEYFNKFNNLKNEEIENGNSLLGPHRDDFSIIINGFYLKNYGSQGQQRTAALCLKLALLDSIKVRLGKYPILLLDDVMSELDSDRRNILIDIINKNIQTFITTTDLNLVKKLDLNSQVFYVKDGKIFKGIRKGG